MSAPPAAWNVSGTYRWFSLNACVTDPSGMSATLATRAASGVWTAKLPAVRHDGGAEPMTGRAPLNRYGGE